MRTARETEKCRSIEVRLLMAMIMMAVVGALVSVILNVSGPYNIKSNWWVAGFVTALVNLFVDATDTHHLVETRESEGLEAAAEVAEQTNHSMPFTVIVAIVIGQGAGIIAALLH